MRNRIQLNDGKYTVVYDETNSFPEKVFRYGEEWRDVTGDNLIYWLCVEIMKSKGED